MSEIKVMNNDEIRDFCIRKDLKIFELEREIQQKENIIKEVREYIEKTKMFTYDEEKEFFLKDYWYGKELLEILDKENKE